MSSAVHGAPAAHAVRVQEVPDPQVPVWVSRRTYAARYKLEVSAEYEAAAGPARGSVRSTLELQGAQRPHPHTPSGRNHRG